MDQKIENMMNLALKVPQNQRAKTSDLSVGFNSADKSWELIIRYSGDIVKAAQKYNVLIKVLSGGYALIVINEELINEFSNLPEVIFMEKPKKLYFSTEYSKVVSCISEIAAGKTGLTGEGVIIAIIDSGIDYFHPEFLDAEGNTRIIAIFDENKKKIFSREEINQSIKNKIILTSDNSGHGTHVASIAAGNSGVAPKAELLIVKLGTDEFFSSARLMEALDYVYMTALALKRPLSVNLSFGNNYGSHDGTSLLETYIDYLAGTWKSVISAGTGNEANKNIHYSGNLTDEAVINEFIIGEYETSIDMQLWKNYADDFNVTLISPSGFRAGPIYYKDRVSVYRENNAEIYVYYGEPAPYSPYQELFFQWVPDGEYLKSGIWKILLEPLKIVDGHFDFWLSSGLSVSTDTGFLKAVPDVTLTIPSTASSVISVGAYDVRTLAYAPFSGRGFTRVEKAAKPDIVASGVNVVAASPGGGYTARTGTSMATPFVAGSAALLMEWGIINGNDPYLYGEKVKAYLIKGAKKLPGFTKYPDEEIGWGALCVANSIP